MIVPEGADAALARVDALHTALSQVVLEGGDLERIACELARALDVGVLVTSTDGRERASGGLTPRLRAALAEAGLTEPAGRFRVERAHGEGVPVGAGELRMLRVVAGGSDLGRLVCLRARGPISAEDVHALERAAVVAALLITREQAVSAVENRYRGDFLRDLFLGRGGDPAYVVEHVRAFGWDLARPMVVVCAELDAPDPREGPAPGWPGREWQERFSLAWSQVSREIADGVPSADFSSEVVTLLPVGGRTVPGPGRLGLPEEVARAVAAVAGDKGGGRRSFSVGVSRVVDSLDGLPTAYAQARRAVEVGRRVRGPGSTTSFDQLGLHRLIALVPDAAELSAFAHDVLGPLAEPTPEAAGLRETLQVLLDTNFNVAEAARLQFFHYNTMRYRVGKLERLLGPLSRDPHLRLDVAVALRVLEIAG